MDGNKDGLEYIYLIDSPNLFMLRPAMLNRGGCSTTGGFAVFHKQILCRVSSLAIGRLYEKDAFHRILLVAGYADFVLYAAKK
jgi:hypothetical protein